MTDEQQTCAICHESMESYHTVVTPSRCTHSFHAICINVWLTRHRSCPLCRRRISLTTQIPWRTLFTTALCITHEMALERAAYAYVFLQLLLHAYTTKDRWRQSRQAMIAAVEQCTIGTIRLPFFDLSTRSTAKRDKRHWKTVYEEISGEHVQRSARIQSAKRCLLMYQFDGLQTFGTVHTNER